MQLMIDTATDTGVELRLASAFLLQLAEVKEGATPVTTSPAAEPPQPVAPAKPTPFMVPDRELPPLPPIYNGSAPPSAAAVFGGPGAYQSASVYAPVAPTPPVPEGTPAPDTDRTGLVWDFRIHSESRALNKDGTWRTKRNCPEDLVRSVTAELRGGERLNPGLSPIPAGAAVPLPPVPLPPTSPAASVPVGLPPAPPQGLTMDFRTLMQKITGHMQAGKLDHPRVVQLVHQATGYGSTEGVGLSSLSQLISQPMYIPAVAEAVDAYIAALSL